MKEKLRSELHKAMKSKDSFRAGVLRMMMAEIINKEKEGSGPVVDEQITSKIFYRMLRQRKDSIEQYQNANRDDLADKEKTEIKIIEEFLPEQLNEEEIKKEARAAIDEVGAEDMKSLGKVMGILSKKLAGKASGGVISKIVKNLLAN